VLAGFHGRDGLRRVEPVLRYDDDRVYVRLQEFVKRRIRVGGFELGRQRRHLGELLYSLRLEVAERDSVHERVRVEILDERAAESTKANHSYADPHSGFSIAPRSPPDAGAAVCRERNVDRKSMSSINKSEDITTLFRSPGRGRSCAILWRQTADAGHSAFALTGSVA